MTAPSIFPSVAFTTCRGMGRKWWKNTIFGRLNHLSVFLPCRCCLFVCYWERQMHRLSWTQITFKNKYPLPPITSAFKPLPGVTDFTELNLRNVYHLIRIWKGDEWKPLTHIGHFIPGHTLWINKCMHCLSSSGKWCVERPFFLPSQKLVQHFLCFSFYWCFIRNYSQVATPLTHLTSPKVPFVCYSEAAAAFT